MNGYMNWMLLKMSAAAKCDTYEDLCERVCEGRPSNCLQEHSCALKHARAPCLLVLIMFGKLPQQSVKREEKMQRTETVT